MADLEKDEDEMKTIGILHYQVAGTDGVSLEINKGQQVLEEMARRQDIWISPALVGSLLRAVVED